MNKFPLSINLIMSIIKDMLTVCERFFLFASCKLGSTRILWENVTKEFKGEKQHDALKENTHGIQYNVCIRSYRIWCITMYLAIVILFRILKR